MEITSSVIKSNIKTLYSLFQEPTAFLNTVIYVHLQLTVIQQPQAKHSIASVTQLQLIPVRLSHQQMGNMNNSIPAGLSGIQCLALAEHSACLFIGKFIYNEGEEHWASNAFVFQNLQTVETPPGSSLGFVS